MRSTLKFGRTMGEYTDMTTQEYITMFQKHLLVGSPKREEIIQELSGHLNEEGQERGIDKRWGGPKKLADQLNRTHLGLFHSLVILYTVPILAYVFFVYILPVCTRLLLDISQQLWVKANIFVSILGNIFPHIMIFAGIFSLSHMINRWRRLCQWAGLFIILALIANAETFYYEVYKNVPGLPFWDNARSRRWATLVSGLQVIAVGGTVFLWQSLTSKLNTFRTTMRLALFFVFGGFLGYLAFFVINSIIAWFPLYYFFPWQFWNYGPWLFAVSLATTLAGLVIIREHRLKHQTLR